MFFSATMMTISYSLRVSSEKCDLSVDSGRCQLTPHVARERIGQGVVTQVVANF